MSFEIKAKDLLARIGRLQTKSGTIETPILLPVINPNIQPILPKKMLKVFKCAGIITNAYIIKKQFNEKAVERGIHDLLDFSGVIATDSGAYQILVYGNIDVTPEEIILYQEAVNSDIATILDVPTGWDVPRYYAQSTVDETLRRAQQLAKIKTRDDISWIGPVQGGQYLDLIARSAKEMGKLPFDIHALGSPTPVMRHYLFDTLVHMIMTAKMNLPLKRPLHLFGAGHPFMFALAVSLGCDLVDSAAYAIYARHDRYMTQYGTKKIQELKYLPCSCSACAKIDPKSLLMMPKMERQKMLAQHNLEVSLSEIRKTKQAITEGRLWEHLELRAHSHPSLLQALKNLGKYSKYLERNSPVTKKKALFFFGSLGLVRPEVFRYRRRLLERYSPPKAAELLILLPQTRTKPFHKSKEQQRVLTEIKHKLGTKICNIHICTYVAPFGVVPSELEEVYPLSQHEIATPLDIETINYVAKQVADYISLMNYKAVILLQEVELFKGRIATACKRACRKKAIPFAESPLKGTWGESTVNDFLAAIQRTLPWQETYKTRRYPTGHPR